LKYLRVLRHHGVDAVTDPGDIVEPVTTRNKEPTPVAEEAGDG